MSLPGLGAPPAYVSDESDESLSDDELINVPHGIEPPAGTLTTADGNSVKLYTTEQQSRLGVDARGRDMLPLMAAKTLAAASATQAEAAAKAAKAAESAAADEAADRKQREAAALANFAKMAGPAAEQAVNPGSLTPRTSKRAAEQLKGGKMAHDEMEAIFRRIADLEQAGGGPSPMADAIKECDLARARMKAAQEAEAAVLARASNNGVEVKYGRLGPADMAIHIEALEAGMAAMGMSPEQIAAAVEAEVGDGTLAHRANDQELLNALEAEELANRDPDYDID